MRIITGKFKKAHLFSVPGKTSRPTTDYTKEVIFSILHDCNDKTVLDLYAGSGSLGLEAISRGASSAVFVDSCLIRKKKVSVYLNNSPEKYDLIFLDPPYKKKLVDKTLEAIFENDLLNPDGKVIVEHSRDEKLDEKWASRIEKQKISGTTRISILGA
jgi:16S rRNA (guanine966-N2)-methyltransferase